MEFYYLWKKTPGANNNRPHRRRRQGSIRRNRNTRTSTNTPPNTKKEETPEPAAVRIILNLINYILEKYMKSKLFLFYFRTPDHHQLERKKTVVH